MPDRWNEERERTWRERNSRYGRDDEYDRYSGDAEERSFGARGSFDPDRDYQAYGRDYQGYGGRFAARRSGADRDRVFGETETGDSYTGDDPYLNRSDRGPRYGGGRYYGDDGRQSLYREEYGQGGRYYGQVPQGYDARLRARERELERERPNDHSRFGFGFDPVVSSAYDPMTAGAPRGYEARDRDARDEGRPHRGWFEKAREEVSSWFNGGEARMSDHRGRGPKGYRRSDERISEEVHDRLTDDPWIDASGVSVTVASGEVTLAGTVPDREAKHRAERLVERCSGVEHVQNNLRVERQGGYAYGSSQGVEPGSTTTGTTDTSLNADGKGAGRA